MKKQQWIVFYNKATGEELCAYTVRGTFPGEMRSTIELLASEHGIEVEQVGIRCEERTDAKSKKVDTTNAASEDIHIKVYPNEVSLIKDFSYWSNCTGDLHHNGNCISEDALPVELADAYKNLWEEEAGGSYCYLSEYRNEYGIALVNEYYEYTDQGEPGEANNFEQACVAAVKVMLKYPETKVFLGKQTGFNNSDAPVEDKATELFVFIHSHSTKEFVREVEAFLYENAYR